MREGGMGWCRRPLRAPQNGEVTDHINSVLLANDVGLEPFNNEPVTFREPSKVTLRMRIATGGPQHEILVLACLDGKAEKTSFTERASNTLKHF